MLPIDSFDWLRSWTPHPIRPRRKVVHNVEDTCKLGTVRGVIVDVVIDRNEPYTHPAKVYFRVKPCLNIVATDSAHVLDQHRLDNTSLNVRKQLLPTRTVKVATAVTIISIVLTVGKSLFPERISATDSFDW